MSIHYKKPVTTVLKERLPWSLSVMGVSLILSLVTGTALALFGMQKKGSTGRPFGYYLPLRRCPPI